MYDWHLIKKDRWINELNLYIRIAKYAQHYFKEMLLSWAHMHTHTHTRTQSFSKIINFYKQKPINEYWQYNFQITSEWY